MKAGKTRRHRWINEGLVREAGREGERWTEIRGTVKQKGGGRRGEMREPRRLTKRRKQEEKSKKRIRRQKCETAGADMFAQRPCDFKNTFDVF